MTVLPFDGHPVMATTAAGRMLPYLNKRMFAGHFKQEEIASWLQRISVKMKETEISQS